MPTEYSAQILKLRLPEQDELKNERNAARLTRLCWNPSAALSANRFESNEAAILVLLPFIR